MVARKEATALAELGRSVRQKRRKSHLPSYADLADGQRVRFHKFLWDDYGGHVRVIFLDPSGTDLLGGVHIRNVISVNGTRLWPESSLFKE